MVVVSTYNVHISNNISSLVFGLVFSLYRFRTSFFDKDLKYTKCVFTEDLNIELQRLFSSALVGTHFSAGRSIF